MKCPSTPRWEFVKNKVYDFIIDHKIYSLPVKLTKLISSEFDNVHLVKFSDIIKNSECYAIPYIKEGMTMYNRNEDVYIIIYNDINIQSHSRMRWTVGHELGHIVLGHLADYDETSTDKFIQCKSTYETFEKESNFFASMILCPPWVLNSLNINSEIQIKDLCEVSSSAAHHRLVSLKKWKEFSRFPTNEKEYKIEKQFDPFVQQERGWIR
jgi:Zn-dependent peptidase ImmA (M78 family)